MNLVTISAGEGHIVAMTGMGKRCSSLERSEHWNCYGVAGTDVAKDAADMVLQDDNFANIVHAVEEGQNLSKHTKFVRYQVSTNIAAVALLVLATVLLVPRHCRIATQR